MTGVHTSRCILSRDSETRIDINSCGIRSSCLAITYRRTIQVAAQGQDCHVVTQSWYEAIDPASYAGAAIGDETRPFNMLAWPSDDPACANYYGYLKRPAVRECGRDDPTVVERPSCLEGEGFMGVDEGGGGGEQGDGMRDRYGGGERKERER